MLEAGGAVGLRWCLGAGVPALPEAKRVPGWGSACDSLLQSLEGWGLARPHSCHPSCSVLSEELQFTKSGNAAVFMKSVHLNVASGGREMLKGCTL